MYENACSKHGLRDSCSTPLRYMIREGFRKTKWKFKMETSSKCRTTPTYPFMDTHVWKTRFDSQGMILNGLKKNSWKKLEWNARPPPFMENFIKNFHFVFRNPSLRKATFTLSKSFEILPGRPAFASLRNELEALQEIRYWGFPPYTEDVSPYVGNFWFAWNNWKQIFCERDFHQLNVAVSSATKQKYYLTNLFFFNLFFFDSISIENIFFPYGFHCQIM